MCLVIKISNEDSEYYTIAGDNYSIFQKNQQDWVALNVATVGNRLDLSIRSVSLLHSEVTSYNMQYKEEQ